MALASHSHRTTSLSEHNSLFILRGRFLGNVRIDPLAPMQRIAVLTGGGDVPGLNAVIKSVVYQTTDMDYEVLEIRRGWEGLTHLRQGRTLDPDYVRLLDRNNTRGIDRPTLGSHERIGIFRIFGRDSGFTALYTAYVTSGRCVIPEVEFELDRLIEILLEDKRNNPSRYSFVIASEGAVWRGLAVAEYGEADAYGHKKKVDIGHALGEEIRQRTGEETMVSDLTYDLRSGDPDALDQIVAIKFANVSVVLITEGARGRLTAVRDGKYTHVPLPDANLGARRIDVPRMYNLSRYRPHYAGRIGSPLLLSTVDS